jgi:hypothetical protein
VSAVAQETIDVRIKVADLKTVRWPKKPLAGDGDRELTPVLLPGMPWSTAAVDVPLGATAARKVARVRLLRRIYAYVVVPLIVLLFVVADVLLILGALGTLHVGRQFLGYLGGVGFVLALTGLLPNAVARFTRTPHVAGAHLRIPAARPEVVKDAVRLNRKGVIETL